MILETNKIYCADCLELMKEMEDNSVDLVLTDPPYGINMDGGNVGYKGFNNFEKKEWDSEKPKDNYFNELFRVSKNQMIFGGNYFNLPPSRCIIVWDKGAGFKNRTYAECEICWTSFDKNARIYKRDPLARGDYKNKLHPTQKPIKLFEWCLEKYSEEGQTIFDPFLGSGTTAVACINTGRNFIGIEKDADYFEIAQRRIKNALEQTRLF